MLFAIPDVAPIPEGIGALSSVEDFVAELDAKHDFVAFAVEACSYDGGVWAVPPYNRRCISGVAHPTRGGGRRGAHCPGSALMGQIGVIKDRRITGTS